MVVYVSVRIVIKPIELKNLINLFGHYQVLECTVQNSDSHKDGQDLGETSPKVVDSTRIIVKISEDNEVLSGIGISDGNKNATESLE